MKSLEWKIVLEEWIQKEFPYTLHSYSSYLQLLSIDIIPENAHPKDIPIDCDGLSDSNARLSDHIRLPHACMMIMKLSAITMHTQNPVPQTVMWCSDSHNKPHKNIHVYVYINLRLIHLEQIIQET